MFAMIAAAATAATDPIGSAAWWSANVLAVLTLTSGVVAGLFAAIKWRTDEGWKRTAAALERVKSFGETPGTRNAMMILKSRRRPIPIFDPAHPPKVGIYRIIGWAEAKDALLPTIWNPDETAQGNAIRDSFEDFINRMTQIEVYVAAGLIKESDAQPLVVPWAERLLWDGDGGLARNLRMYVELEGYSAFQRLFARFGCDLQASFAKDIAAMKDEYDIDDASFDAAFRRPLNRFTARRRPPRPARRWPAA